MAKPRDPHKNHKLATARVNDFTDAELREIAAKSGVPLSKVIRMAIKKGLPWVRSELLKDT